MMEKRNKIPHLRFPDFKDEWESNKLGELGTFFSGGTPLTTKRSYFDGQIPFIRSGEINSNKTVQFISDDGLKNSSAKMIEVGDLVYALYGATSGEVAISKIKGAINQAILCIRTKLDNIFLFNYFLLNKQNIINTYLQGGQGNLSADIVKSLNIPYPNLVEQKRIASVFAILDKKISELKQKKSLLEEYKKGIMQKLFSQEVRFKDENGKEFPKWENKKLGEVSVISMGQSPDSKAYNNEGNGKPLIQGNADIHNRKSNPRNWTTHITKECSIGDLILTVRAPVGAVAKSMHNACIGRGVCSIRNNSQSNMEFLYQFLLDYELRWIRLEQGSTFTAISGSDIKSIEIKVPSMNEQTKIANFLATIDDKINRTDNQIDQTQQYKKGLLQNMFI